ncbi:hypothetical protein Tco_0128865 [Tanacetum coccineum]
MLLFRCYLILGVVTDGTRAKKRKWRSLAEEKDNLLGAKDKEIEELRSQLLKAKEESVMVAQLRARVSSLEAIEGSLRGEVASVKGTMNTLLEISSFLLVRSPRTKTCKVRYTSLETSSARLRSRNAFGRAIEKGMQEGLAAGIEHGQAGRCLTDLEAYIPSAEIYENPDLVDVVSENVTLGPKVEENIDASTGGDLAFSKLDDEARDVVL